MDTIPTRLRQQPDFDPTSAEAKFQLRQQLVEDRQRELEAEQAKLEEEHKRIEQRRLELEAEKQRHAVERERLKKEAEEAQKRAELERKRLERQQLEQHVEQERQKVAQKLAALEAERERERERQERLEKEAEAERRRAEQRLQELQVEQELRRTELERVALEAKQELEEAERRLRELSATGVDASSPETVNADSAKVVRRPALAAAAAKPAERRQESGEISVPDFSGRPARTHRAPIIGAAVAVLIVGAVMAWFFVPASEGPAPTAAVHQQLTVPSEPLEPSPEPSPISAEEQVSAAAPESSIADELSEPEKKRPNISAVAEKKKPTAGKPATEKKRVTVDDLINDN